MDSIGLISAMRVVVQGIGPEIAQKERAKAKAKAMIKTSRKEAQKEKQKEVKDQRQDAGAVEATTTKINAQ